MTGLALELRRGIGKWLCLPLAVIGIFGAQPYLEGGASIWPISASALALSVQLAGPLAAGAAAHAGSRSRRHRTDSLELLSAKHPSSAALAEVVALQVWFLTAFLIVTLAIYVPTAMEATWSGPPVLRTVVIALGLALIVTVAFIVGRALPHRFTPIFAAFLTYAVIVLGYSGIGYSYGLFSPADLNVYDQYRGPKLSVLRGQFLWYTGLAGTVFIGWAYTRAPGKKLIGALASTLAVVAVGAATLAGQHGQAYGPMAASNWSCEGDGVELCIHPAMSKGRQSLETVIDPIAARLVDTPFAVSRLEQRPRGIGSKPTAGALAFALDDLRSSSLRGAGQDVAVNALGLTPELCLTEGGEYKEGYALAQIVTTWIVSGETRDFLAMTAGEKKAVAWFDRLSEDQRRFWLREHEARIKDCDLTTDDFRA